MIADPNTAARLDAITNALQIQNFVDSIDDDRDKRAKEQGKETRELITAIGGLNKTLEKTGKDKDKSALSKGVSGWLGELSRPLKQMTSLRGITEMAAGRAGSGLVGSVLTSAAEGMRDKEEAKEKKKSFVSSVLTGTEVGRTWQSTHGTDKAVEMVSKIYRQRESLLEEIALLEEKQKLIQGDGSVQGADLNAEDSARLEKLEEDLVKNKKLFATEKSESNRPGKDKAKKAKEKIRDDILDDSIEDTDLLPPERPKQTERLQPEDDYSLEEYPSDANRDKILHGVREQLEEDNASSETISVAMSELESIGREQLEQLINIADNLSRGDMEDKEKLLETVEERALSIRAPEPDKKSFLDSIMNGFKTFKGFFGKIFGKIGPLLGRLASMLPAIMSAIGPALAVAGAAAAGFAIGDKLVNPLLNKAAGAITGDENATVGTAIYDGVDKVAGSAIGNMLGFKSDAQKTEEIRINSEIDLGQKRLAEGGKVQQYIADTMRKSGLTVDDSKILKPGEKNVSTPLPAAASSTASSSEPEKSATPTPVPADASSSEPEKSLSDKAELALSEKSLSDKAELALSEKTTDATLIAEKLNERTTMIESMEHNADKIEEAKKAPPITSSVVNAPTVVNQSTSNTTVSNKPIRNQESSYNIGLNRKLVF